MNCTLAQESPTRNQVRILSCFCRQRGDIKGQTHKLAVQNVTVKSPVT